MKFRLVDCQSVSLYRMLSVVGTLFEKLKSVSQRGEIEDSGTDFFFFSVDYI